MKSEETGSKRQIQSTKRYDAFVGHYGMDASRNNRGEAQENGAVESQNRHLKTAIKQALILRGSRDFGCVEDYRRFIDTLVARRNRQRAAAVQAERAHLKPLPKRRTTGFTEIVVPVIYPFERRLPACRRCRSVPQTVGRLWRRCGHSLPRFEWRGSAY